MNPLDAKAYELRQSGMKLAEVGAALGVSVERARQRVAKFKRRQEEDAAMRERGVEGLSLRSQFALFRFLGSNWTLDDLRASPPSERQLIDSPNVGTKSINEIKAWVAERGLSLKDEVL